MWTYSVHVFTFIILVDFASASSCNKIIEQNDSLPKRYLSVDGVIRNISLYWGSEPAFIASTLLAVILRYKMGYQNVKLVKGSNSLERFAQQVPYNSKQKYNEAILAISLAWDPSSAKPRTNIAYTSGLAGPRLFQFGASSVPVQQRLYAHVADKYRRQEQCKNITKWKFYVDKSALKKCGFLLSNDLDEKLIVYGSNFDIDHTLRNMRKLEERAQFIIKSVMVNSSDLIQKIQFSNQSFLFVDYDIWSRHPNVTIIQPPPCIPIGDSPCTQELDTTVAMRIGDVYTFLTYSPQLYQAIYNFLPSTQTIRTIIQLHSQEISVEEAACQWVLEHNNTVASWLGNYKPNEKLYELAVFYCFDDPDFNNYDKILEVLHTKIIPSLYRPTLNVGIRLYKILCHNINSVREQLFDYMSTIHSQRLIGAVVGAVRNVTDVVKTLNGAGVPVLFCDAPGIDADNTVSTWLTSGSTLHMAAALHHFIKKMHWTRVGIISEPTATAKRFIDELRFINDSIGFGDHTVKLNLKESDAAAVLNKLRDEKAKIILVNTNYIDAVTILSTAAKLKINAAEEFAWIVREWKPYATTTDIEHFTLSFSPVCGGDVSNTMGLRDFRNKISEPLKNCSSEDSQTKSWPVQGTALVDAVLTLVHGFNYSIHKNSEIRDDVHSNQSIKLFETSLITTSVQGLNQILTYKGHSLEETLVFLYKWRGSKHVRLARWRVNATNRIVTEEQNWRPAYLLEVEVPHDGALQCTLKFGNSYSPTCYDTYLWIGVLLIVMVVLAYFAIRHHLKEKRKNFICKLLAQRQQRAAAISSSYLIDRSAVTMREELGAGRFGLVRLAELRVLGRAPKYVAAKVLRENQDEREILHEGCILASLNHDNIIRLVGVCIDNEPPIILMEVAFFGDLLRYLQHRRYLAERTFEILKVYKANEEATHISAEALTRLARQAASALEYLSKRGVIHRDLRASNCLVDANRSLKLADFGLARETVTTGLESGAEYRCIRRGLFPVLWMAPESLEQGIFSAASDVWALGVLILEIVTLGARPFGDMPPHHVMQFVARGGKPPLPLDAATQTIDLVRMCWQREPEHRPSAAEIVMYLAERPFALTPALECDYDEPVVVDSGYGASPTTEMLPY